MSATAISKEEAKARSYIGDIKAAYQAMKKSRIEMIGYAIQIGGDLWKMKESCQHGQFRELIEEQFDFSYDSANDYMKLSEGWHYVVKKLGKDVAKEDLSIRSGLKLIRDNSPPPESNNKRTRSISENETQADRGKEDAPKTQSTAEDSRTFKNEDGEDLNEHVKDFKEEEAEKPTKLDLASKQAPYDAYLNHITQAKKIWNEIVADERDGVYAVDKRQRVLTALKSVYDPVAQARPFAVCDHCQGKGCKKCSSTGWWPRSVVEGHKK